MENVKESRQGCQLAGATRAERQMGKSQRVRDPVHNLIEFDGGDFEQTCWKVLQTRPMQRLRRVKQLGFSEYTYPGASHTRLSHSIGVFHTARLLAEVVRKSLGNDHYRQSDAQIAIAAALVHDVGHGPFSHAFEDALKKLKKGRKHELRTRQIMQTDEMQEAFEDYPELPEQIADLIEAEFPTNIYASIVSSQMDADRLDYMRRDRMMSGTQQSGIDFDWLLSNLEVQKVPVGQDGKFVRKAYTFVINEKAVVAAEGYIFSLLYLYKNVYFHKTTRGLEKIFTALVFRIAELVQEGSEEKAGLHSTHPLVRFLRDVEDIENFLALDDTVVLGSLNSMSLAPDGAVAELAIRLRDRKIYKCIDVTNRMMRSFGLPKEDDDADAQAARGAEAARRVARVAEMVAERGLLTQMADNVPLFLEDTAPRSPYKRVDSSRLFSRIHVAAGKDLHDLAEMSPAVNSLSDYKAYRLYGRDRAEVREIERIIEEASQ